MGVDYDKCDVDGETYPDCGDVRVRYCSEGHGVCSDCVSRQLEFVTCEQFANGEPGVEDEDENLLEKYCPLCNPQNEKNLKRFKVMLKSPLLGTYVGKTEFDAKFAARKELKNLDLFVAEEVL